MPILSKLAELLSLLEALFLFIIFSNFQEAEEQRGSQEDLPKEIPPEEPDIKVCNSGKDDTKCPQFHTLSRGETNILSVGYLVTG